jgi:hypothetical protein
VYCALGPMFVGAEITLYSPDEDPLGMIKTMLPSLTVKLIEFC